MNPKIKIGDVISGRRMQPDTDDFKKETWKVIKLAKDPNNIVVKLLSVEETGD